MNRRQVLSGVGFLAAAATTVEQGRSQSSAGAVNKALVSSASDCVGKGEVCLSHCLELLATGDKSMSACAKSTNEMLAVCGALLSIAAQGAPSLSKLAGIAFDICRRCETECRKHAHAPCTDCAVACAACAAECKKIAA
ncbi:MAG: Csp1 family four helix bundle copper storage protein [Bryobacteraceae bacterium]|jgi:Cys-rich four helix bundle protein (predicted Tat secretion target)